MPRSPSSAPPACSPSSDRARERAIIPGRWGRLRTRALRTARVLGIAVLAGAGMARPATALQTPPAASGPGAADIVGTFDHSAFSSLLARHVSDAGLVDYDAFRHSETFDRYLGQLADVDLATLGPDERLALWINAYNAYTIRLINREDETESIRNINRTLGLFSTGGAFRVEIATVADTTRTLDEIEHDIIRERFDDPRIHFALVCAALGCPPLRQEAYVGGRLDEQLDEQARVFLLESPEKNRVDVDRRRVWLSPIFDWFEEDFGDSREAVGRYVARFHPPGPTKGLLESGDFDIEYTDYDWSLNTPNR